MTAHAMNETVERQLLWRYATKRFDPSKKISDRDWETLEQALLQAPSSFGLQPWRVITVTDTTVREKLRSVSWNQPQVVEGSHLVVLASRTSMGTTEVDAAIRHICDTRNTSAETLAGYREVILSFLGALEAKGSIESWCTHQAYLALGLLLSTAAILHVDACPLEGIDPAAYDDILGLTGTGLRTKVACAMGYRSDADQTASFRKVRIPREELFLRR